jgi:hypothetical protein
LREEREREEVELHDAGVKYDKRIIMTDENYRKELVSRLKADVEEKNEEIGKRLKRGYVDEVFCEFCKDKERIG